MPPPTVAGPGPVVPPPVVSPPVVSPPVAAPPSVGVPVVPPDGVSLGVPPPGSVEPPVSPPSVVADALGSPGPGGCGWSAPSWSWRSKDEAGVFFSASWVYWAQIWVGGPPPFIRAWPSAPYSGMCLAVTGSWPITETTVARSGV